jgi:hypothetical protein
VSRSEGNLTFGQLYFDTHKEDYEVALHTWTCCMDASKSTIEMRPQRLLAQPVQVLAQSLRER